MSSLEMDSWINVQLICKPEQSGKTFLMIQHIIREIGCPIEGKTMINIILCDNNLLLTKQTSERVDAEITEFTEGGVAYVELSSHSRAACHDMAAVFLAIVSKGIHNVICCTNGRRMDDVYQLIHAIHEDSEFTRDKFHTNIWLDEGDQHIGFIDNTLIPLVRKFDQVHVKVITATPEPLFKKYKYMNVLPLENTTTEEYHGWEDNTIHTYPKGGCIEFAGRILTTVAKDRIQPRTKWFIPAMRTKSSHEEMKDLCLSFGMAVLCVNGEGIVLSIPGKEPVQVKKDSEINSMIRRLYVEYDLEQYAFVITGNICIGRGISILSRTFMIDYAILSYYVNKNDASQLAGRLKGNIKRFDGYNPRGTTVFTTEEFNQIAIQWEEKSRNLAKVAHQRERDGYGTILDKNDFATCDKEFEYICHPTLFDSFKYAKDFLATKEREMDCKGKVKLTSKSALHDCGGYLVSSKLLTTGQTVESLTQMDRLTIEKAVSIVASRCISSTDKGSRYLILPVYETLETPPKDVKFQVRYIRFKRT